MTEVKHKEKKVGKQRSGVAEQTKRDILEASLHCFATKGYTSTSLRDIAEKANTTHGLIRHHFGSKEALWKTCIPFAANQVAALQVSVIQKVTPENALDSLKALVRTMVYSTSQFPDFWRLLSFEALKNSERLDYLLDVLRPTHEEVKPLFEMVQKQGYFKNFNNDTFFLFVVSLSVTPFTQAAFSNKLCNIDIQSEKHTKAHADLVIGILFNEHSA
jgi:AcrR family transcriptional regulator